MFGLLGPNGAGKSTTVKILTTLSRPDAGSARVAGHDVLRRARRVRRAIGVVAQKPAATARPPAARTSYCRASSTESPARARAPRRRAAGRFGLADAADRLVKT